MNTLHTQQYKHTLSGESVNQFRANKMKEPTQQQRIEQLEKKFNTVVYFSLVLGIALFIALVTR
ncbi:hypothetical protein [Providencia manganoxydans]|uniref:hypothetical protein n=1 Tax=Providencia manganoxydans TaxID=2923283 RepID=UPI0034E55B09